jgi:uncharacterized protein YciI
MTRWVAIFEDDPDAADARFANREAHFDYLAQHADRILLAGGLRPDADAFWTGGLWVIEAETREDAVRLCEADPFFTAGLRKSYRLAIWGRAPCYGEPNSVRL